jgi:hydroquinone glucosyltransferase
VPTNSSASAAFFNAGSDVSDPKTYLPTGFLERTQERGLVVPSWAPQVLVLKHPSTGGFLTHCGWNSTLEAVTHGMPMIAWPLYAEQRMNATILAEEIGIAIKPVAEPGASLVGREEVERVVRLAILEGKEMRKKIEELKDSAAKAMEIGGSSYDSLACLAKEWKS